MKSSECSPDKYCMNVDRFHKQSSILNLLTMPNKLSIIFHYKLSKILNKRNKLENNLDRQILSWAKAIIVLYYKK